MTSIVISIYFNEIAISRPWSSQSVSSNKSIPNRTYTIELILFFLCHLDSYVSEVWLY